MTICLSTVLFTATFFLLSMENAYDEIGKRERSIEGVEEELCDRQDYWRHCGKKMLSCTV